MTNKIKFNQSVSAEKLTMLLGEARDRIKQLEAENRELLKTVAAASILEHALAQGGGCDDDEGHRPPAHLTPWAPEKQTPSVAASPESQRSIGSEPCPTARSSMTGSCDAEGPPPCDIGHAVAAASCTSEVVERGKRKGLHVLPSDIVAAAAILLGLVVHRMWEDGSWL